MTHDELIAALRRLKVETGSLACLGCGHEHNCSTQGCAILREAVEELEHSVPVVRYRGLDTGSIVWAVERDEDNAPHSVAGVVFLAAVGEAVICSPMINGHKDVQYITDYCIKETARDWSSSAKYFPISDVYAAREEAVAALSREEARDGA